MKISLIFFSLVSIYVRTQATTVDEHPDDGYYLELVQRGKTMSMEEIVSQFNCFKDQFSDPSDIQIINDIEIQLSQSLGSKNNSQSFSLLDIKSISNDPSVRGAKLDSQADKADGSATYFNVSYNVLKNNQKEFQNVQKLFFQPSVTNCIKVIPQSCKFSYSVDDIYQRVCDQYSQSGKILADSIVRLSVDYKANPNDVMAAIQTCRKTHITTFSLPFQCTAANAVIKTEDVYRELVRQREIM